METVVQKQSKRQWFWINAKRNGESSYSSQPSRITPPMNVQVYIYIHIFIYTHGTLGMIYNQTKVSFWWGCVDRVVPINFCHNHMPNHSAIATPHQTDPFSICRPRSEWSPQWFQPEKKKVTQFWGKNTIFNASSTCFLTKKHDVSSFLWLRLICSPTPPPKKN